MKLKTAAQPSSTAKKGFTLIELLVVIAIIGLLASIVLIALNNARQKSRDAKRLADIKQIATALELYFNTYNAYPTCGTGSYNDNGNCWDNSTDGVFLPDLVNNGILAKAPLDPLNNSTYYYTYYGNPSWTQSQCGIRATALIINSFETTQTNHGDGSTCSIWSSRSTNGYVQVFQY